MRGLATPSQGTHHLPRERRAFLRRVDGAVCPSVRAPFESFRPAPVADAGWREA